MQRMLLAVMCSVFLYTASVWAQNVNAPAKLVSYPQMILYNGKIVSMDDTSFTSNAGTIAQAMAIRDGPARRLQSSLNRRLRESTFC